MVLMRRSAAVVGAELEIRFMRDTEHPVHPLPCNHNTLGPFGLANARSRVRRSSELRARVAEDAVQNLRKSRREMFI
jgi:hypothetical protein